MNEALKKLSEEIRGKLEKALGTTGIQETIAATRAANAADTGTFEVIISTAAVDRQGESIDQNGWDLTFYKLNPVVLWAHDYYSMPIGVCDEIGVQDGKLVAKGRFAPAEANPFAQQVRALYDAGMLRTTSVGFIAKEVDGENITKAELLEFSFVPVPANPMALSLRQLKELGIDREALAVKGITTTVKAEGETCTLEDGTEGVIDANGVCVPKPAEEAKAEPKEGDPCTMDDGSEGVMTMQDGALVCALKPAEEAPAEGGDGTEAEKGQKGAVQDELDAEEAWEDKWDNLDTVCDAIDAFFNVYLDQNTKPEQFGELLTELAGILTQIAAGNGTEGGDGSPTEASLNTGTIKALIGKAKRIVTRVRVEKAMGIEMTTKGDDPKDGASSDGRIEPEETAGGQAAEQRSNDAGSDAIESLKKWSEERAVLREIATIVGDALAKANAKAKGKAHK